jgi:pimeloyl-ACP methyl ester carboxylesterase
VSGRRLVDTRFGQVHVRTANDSSPGRPLVLLHMSPRSSRMWEPLQRALDRPTYAVDRLGYGFSDAPPHPLSMEDYTRATLDALESLGLKDFDVLGMHTGSLEAIELAHQAPGHVRRCGIVAVPVFDDAEKRAMAAYTRQVLEPSEDGAHLARAWRARFQYRTPPFDLDDVQRRFVDFVLSPDPGAAYVAVFGYDAATRLRACPAPLTAIVPRDDVYEVSMRSRALLPDGATWLDCSDLGLDLFRTDVPEVLSRAREFFAT